MTDPAFLDSLRFDSDGLIPAIVQDAETRDVLMMAWMDRPAVMATIESGQTHFYSRSRRMAWHKGGTSGHVQHVEEVRLDCDADVILLLVRQVGGACHEGYRSCFFRKLDATGQVQILGRRVFDPERVYARPVEPSPLQSSSDVPADSKAVS